MPIIHNNNDISIITIDGPSGTGKGTLCLMLGEYLQWHVLDSGVLYRVLALLAQQKNIAYDDTQQLCYLAKHLNVAFLREPQQPIQVFLDNINITTEIRNEVCGNNASKIAAIFAVRQELIMMQRQFAKLPGLVTDGRDMGTVIFPQAQIKIYLDATMEERAQRRYLQLQEQEINVSLAVIIDELKKRDCRDTQRAHAPLVAAANAIHIDTTRFTIVQTFDYVLQLLGMK